MGKKIFPEILYLPYQYAQYKHQTQPITDNNPNFETNFNSFKPF